MADVIVAEALVKRFGKTVALDGLSFTVPEGTLLGVLGPNGAGKTTAVRILATLLRPDSGRATVLGMDVVHEADRVRHVIGLTGQYAAVDELLTGRENLVMVGRLFRLGRAEARRRAGDLLERFDLSGAANRPVRTYSGGMRRRLDIAASLIATPRVLFLDEPTTGLDPRSRIGMWEVIEDLVGAGTTMLLTTQNLDEADRLATTIAVIDVGRVIAQGTSDQLKAQVGGVRLEVTVAEPGHVDPAVAALRHHAAGELTVDREARHVVVPVSADGAGCLPGVVRDLDAAGVTVADLALRRPTLDDVFLALTGHAAEAGLPAATKGGNR
ncbi:MAG TPA: ATP-binding cassette domain-containing protein [Mycobacteriales bacterium]